MLSMIVAGLARILILIVFVDVIISYFLPPYHTVRETLDRIVNPMLDPIRRFVPSFSGIDFSPVILLVLISVIESLLLALFRTLHI